MRQHFSDGGGLYSTVGAKIELTSGLLMIQSIRWRSAIERRLPGIKLPCLRHQAASQFDPKRNWSGSRITAHADLNRILLTSTSSGWLMHLLSLASTIR